MITMPKRTQQEFETPYPLSEDFKAAWAKWKAYKKAEHNFTYKSVFSEQEAANNLYKLSKGNVELAMGIISKAIERGWKGFFQSDNITTGTATPKGPAPEVYSTAPVIKGPPPETAPAQPITDREMALAQFKAFKEGVLTPVYVYPTLYTYLFKKRLIKKATGEGKASLLRRAKLLRTSQLSKAATDKAALKYVEKVVKEFGDDNISEYEMPYVRSWAQRLAVIDYFTYLREARTELEPLLKD